MKATPNSFERERRKRLLQLAWCGEGCFDSRCLVNSDVGRVIIILIGESCMKHNFVIVFLLLLLSLRSPGQRERQSKDRNNEGDDKYEGTC